MAGIIDTHQHFWDIDRFEYRWLAPDVKTLYRNFLPHHLQPLLQRAGVEKTIVVQALGEAAENDWALGLAAQNPFIAGVVGWVDIFSPGVARQLARLQGNPRFRGVRLGVNKQMIEEKIVRREAVLALRAINQARITCDVLVHPENLFIVRTIAAAFPETPFIVNHAGNPPLRSRQLDDWAAKMRLLAKLPNVTCKLSGLVTLCDAKTWTPDDLKPCVQVMAEAFGFDRLMYGSDWPVCLLAAPYQDVLEALVTALGPITPADKEKVMAETARRVYRLG